MRYMFSEEDMRRLEREMEELYRVAESVKSYYPEDMKKFAKALVSKFGSLENAAKVLALHIYYTRFCERYANKINMLLRQKAIRKGWNYDITRVIYDWMVRCYPLYRWYNKFGWRLHKGVKYIYSLLKSNILYEYNVLVPSLYIARVREMRLINIGETRIYIGLYEMIRSIMDGEVDCHKYGFVVQFKPGDIASGVSAILSCAFAQYMVEKSGVSGTKTVSKYFSEFSKWIDDAFAETGAKR